MKKHLDKFAFIIIILFIISIITFTVGYAFSDISLDMKGIVTVYRPEGSLIIESIVPYSSDLPAGSGQGLKLEEDGSIGLDFNFKLSSRSEKTYTATYLVTLFNDTRKFYLFSGINLSPVVNIVGVSESDATASVTYEYIDVEGSNLNLQNNEIPSGERRVLAVKLSIYVASNKAGASIGVSGGADIFTSQDNTGNFYGYLDPANQELDLRNNDIDCFTFKVLNTYKTPKTFLIKPGKNSYRETDSLGISLQQFSVDAPSETNPENNIGSYTACLKVSDSALFLNENDTTSIILQSTDGTAHSIGSINVKVNKTEEKDEEKVHIGNVSFNPIKYNITNNSLEVSASWEHLPDTSDKSSNIKNYYMLLYDENISTSTPVYTFTVPGDAPIGNYIFSLDTSNYLNESNMVTNNHSYFIKVYGEDEAGNTGSADCSSTGNDFCVKSNSTSLKYKFNVTLSSSSNRVSFVNNSQFAYLNAQFKDQLQVTANNYRLDSTVTINMGEQTFTNGNEYIYGLDSNSTTKGTLTIAENIINNDIYIEASSTYSNNCLAAGTKIRLANGTTKNIEDVRYDDLILAVSHDTGKIVYEYPIWIEKKSVSHEYQVNVFSDGTELKTIGGHGVYSVDANRYVSVLDKDNFHVGTKIIKVNENNELTTVEVVKIETKYEDIDYYHVSSTYYHNVIANDLLTTDAMLIVSNMYEFNKDLTWSDERKIFMSHGIFFNYEDWKDVFPSHIFKGFRMKEATILAYKGVLDISQFDDVLNFQIFPPTVNENGKILWTVSTSDNVNNDESKLFEEGSIYILPNPINVDGMKFKGWEFNNQLYMPGDSVEVIYGMHFNALWE